MSLEQEEWLKFLEISGPFLEVPVLKEVFVQGLEGVGRRRVKHLRQAYDEWRDAVDQGDPELKELHRAWIDEVIVNLLEMEEQVLRKGLDIPDRFTLRKPEHDASLVPDMALVDTCGEEQPLLLVQLLKPQEDLDTASSIGAWISTPAERMRALLRNASCPLGLVTNGERWTLVHAPSGSVASFATWDARAWFQEEITLRAFVSLLGLRRFFGPEGETLPKLFERSAEYQGDVTATLGDQVRQAVEVLIQALDRADQDRGRKLLEGVEPRELYEAALTVMMRLVFLLAAEERGLLLLGDPIYDLHYSVSTLGAQLRELSQEILERRRSAWSRLLALFRAVYGGIDHPNLPLPALGGSLFDPDRFPFLEGRSKGTTWANDPSAPLPIDDRTVLLLLEAIQIYKGRRLSYRALDVEQIGHVYEGLLERTVSRVEELTLVLEAGKKAKETRVTLKELESALAKGKSVLLDLLVERSLRSRPSIERDLTLPVEGHLAAKLLAVCRGDMDLRKRILPFARLLRTDPWGYPLVYSPDAFVVGLGSDRRETGTHYTPKALTERIVEETLIPCVYEGPSKGKPPAEWTLKSPAELLDLKICDPAMGSGAFLVQVCRWLGDRLVESWNLAEEAENVVDIEGHLHSHAEEESGAARSLELLPKDPEERGVLARRSIAENCLYGVDINPMAVELAKLSIWLTTMAKGHPFGFLDHNLKSGDSLLGIAELDQLVELSPKPKRERQIPLFGWSIKAAVDEALSLRKQLRAIPLRDISDVQAMERLDKHARKKLEIPESIADAFVGIVLSKRGDAHPENHLKNLAAEADRIFGGDTKALERLARTSAKDLSFDSPNGQPRRPFHWPLEFPEVFVRPRGGFDEIVGNPPFLGGQKITGALGTKYRDWLVNAIAEGRKGSADLVAYFFLRTFSLLREGGGFGLLAVNTIAEGDTRQVGLESMIKMGATIHAAYPNEPWPGSAAVVTSRVHVRRGEWNGQRSLLGKPVSYISPFLSEREEWSPKRLKANEGIAFQGSIVLGMGFILTHDEAQRMLDADPRNADVIFPYLNGEDLNSDPEQKPSRWVINFWDWPEEKARTYKLPFGWIEERVKPERQRRKSNGTYALRKPLPERWWQYEKNRSALYHAIERGHLFDRHQADWDLAKKSLKKVIVAVQTSKYISINYQPNNAVFSHMIVVFNSEDPALFASLNSNIHAEWVKKYSASIGLAQRYFPTDCFETFPLGDLYQEKLYFLGITLERIRKKVMSESGLGFTKLYNCIHDKGNTIQIIQELRKLHMDIDSMVLKTYGWEDLTLDHDFYELSCLPENDKIRFTISEAARVEVLNRLAELNRQRYEEENARFLPDAPSRKRVAAKSKPASGKRKKTSANKDLEPDRSLPSPDLGPPQGKRYEPEPVKKEPAVSSISPQKLLLFEEPAPSAPPAGKELDAVDRILDFLRSGRSWVEKEAILKGTDVPESHWTEAIVKLRDRGLIERLGEGKKARYRAI
jgi:hypothetical protein